MAKVLMHKSHYKILYTHKNSPYVLKDCDGDYCQHSHFSTLKGAIECLDYILKKQIPINEYMVEAVTRIVGVEVLETFTPKRKKPRYRNISRR